MTTQIGFLDILIAWQQGSSLNQRGASLKNGMKRTALALFLFVAPEFFSPSADSAHVKLVGLVVRAVPSGNRRRMTAQSSFSRAHDLCVF